MTDKRFQRPIEDYSGAEDLLYTDKYQQDSKTVPKIAISSAKIDGDFNYIVDAVNTLDEDVKSIVYSGVANETILAEHISSNAVTEEKVADDAISSQSLKDGSVTNAKLADLSVTTPKIANNCVTKDKMALESVGTEEIVDQSITRDKLADDAISDSVPVGTIAQFSVDLLPTGWILCSGATLSKNTYPQLVKYLTNSDTELSATIPNLNTDGAALAKFAIKAFSDTIELANVDIAELTQDVAVLEPQVTANTVKGDEAVLFSGSAGISTITLSESIVNYKQLHVYMRSSAGSHGDSVNLVNEFMTSTVSEDVRFTMSSAGTEYLIRYYRASNTSITISYSGGGTKIVKVIGIK
ncbi:MAG: tail fiber protein [Proteobacteria bacterium]|nr:tail fiber protein [Pseudomonadota bacterium]